MFRSALLRMLAVVPLFLVGAHVASAQPADAPVTAGHAMLPVREVTVYKDGHAFVAHQGRAPVSGGNILLDQLPAPVIGTVWAYSSDPAAKLTGLVAGRRFVDVQRTSLSIV